MKVNIREVLNSEKDRARGGAKLDAFKNLAVSGARGVRAGLPEYGMAKKRNEFSYEAQVKVELDAAFLRRTQLI